MTVNPGWGGQRFIEALDRPAARAWRRCWARAPRSRSTAASSSQTGPRCREAGATRVRRRHARCSARRTRPPPTRRWPTRSATRAGRARSARARAGRRRRRSRPRCAAPGRRRRPRSIQATKSAAAASQSAAARAACPRASAAWLSVPAERCRPMPIAISGQAEAAVGVVVVEDVVQDERADREQAERARRPRRRAIASTVMRIARANAARARGRLEAREVGQQRGLDRLEELQRRARDQQHVEDDARQARPRSALVAATVSTAAFSSVCSASWIPETDDREAAAAADREVARRPPRCPPRRAPRAPRRSTAGAAVDALRCAARRANAAGTTTSETNGAAAMPSAIADWPWRDADRGRERERDPRGRLHEDEAAVEREVACGRRASRARSSSRRRRRSPTTKIQ